MVSKSVLVTGAVVLAAVVGAGGTYVAMSRGYNPMDHLRGGMGHRGDCMHLHDEVNMRGLRGENTTPEESARLAVLFRNFDTIMREVENLPNGILSVTRSPDPAVIDVLVSHSVGMIDRVGRWDDPKVTIQSPTLDAFFLHGEDILSNVSVEDEGLIVVQTSDNPEMVEALQTHAAEVTDMADRGMQAVHDIMMASGRSH